MKPVYQKITETIEGDCFRACVASLLERELEEVPHFVGEKPYEQWFGRLVEWLVPQGLGAAYTTWDPLSAAQPGLCIAGVRTERAEEAELPPNWIHAVVGRLNHTRLGWEFEFLHDPHPRPSAILKIMDLTFITRNACE